MIIHDERVKYFKCGGPFQEQGNHGNPVKIASNPAKI
jgi:hypothetical protein